MGLQKEHYRPFKKILSVFLSARKNKKGDRKIRSPQVFEMAEREGFEPSMEVSPHTRLAGERLQPTRPSLRKWCGISGGGSRIRTHGALTLNGFQDRRLQPLGHPSRCKIDTHITEPNGGQSFCCFSREKF